jgi:hypothetical protein
MTTTSHYGLIGLSLSLLSLTIWSAPVAAQAQRQVSRSPEELIAGLIDDQKEVGGAPSGALLDLTAVLLGRSDYPSAKVEAVLNGLEHLALAADSPQLRAAAAWDLTVPGSRDAVHARPNSIARLDRVYRKSKDNGVRASIVSGLARSGEGPQALAMLETIALKDQPDYPGSALSALTSMKAHKDQGNAALKRLHEARAVRDPEARRWLDREAACN